MRTDLFGSSRTDAVTVRFYSNCAGDYVCYIPEVPTTEIWQSTLPANSEVTTSCHFPN